MTSTQRTESDIETHEGEQQMKKEEIINNAVSAARWMAGFFQGQSGITPKYSPPPL